MYAYADYCPVAATTSVVGDYWTPLIVRELLYGTVRFNQLARNLPSISRSLLSDRLRKLEQAGVITCERSGPRATTYAITDAGRDLQPLIDVMTEWGTRWGKREPNIDTLDPVMTVCMLKDRLRSDELPQERVVVEVTVTGPQEARAWLVCEAGGASMCFDPPGLDVDVSVRGTAETLYRIWLQELTMTSALRRGEIEVEGAQAHRRSFARWFDGSAARRA